MHCGDHLHFKAYFGGHKNQQEWRVTGMLPAVHPTLAISTRLPGSIPSRPGCFPPITPTPLLQQPQSLIQISQGISKGRDFNSILVIWEWSHTELRNITFPRSLQRRFLWNLTQSKTRVQSGPSSPPPSFSIPAPRKPCSKVWLTDPGFSFTVNSTRCLWKAQDTFTNFKRHG